jgi:hypothetical protein
MLVLCNLSRHCKKCALFMNYEQFKSSNFDKYSSRLQPLLVPHALYRLSTRVFRRILNFLIGQWQCSWVSVIVTKSDSKNCQEGMGRVLIVYSCLYMLTHYVSCGEWCYRPITPKSDWSVQSVNQRRVCRVSIVVQCYMLV